MSSIANSCIIEKATCRTEYSNYCVGLAHLQLAHAPSANATSPADQSRSERIHVRHLLSQVPQALINCNLISPLLQSSTNNRTQNVHLTHHNPGPQRPRLLDHNSQSSGPHAAHRPPSRHTRADTDLDRARDDPLRAGRERRPTRREHRPATHELVPRRELHRGITEGVAV